MSVEGKFLSKEISELFWKENLTLATAESCTAGNVAAGTSHFFKGGIIAYSNEVKENLLGVSHETLETYGAVSEETVIEMVKGAMKSMNSTAQLPLQVLPAQQEALPTSRLAPFGLLPDVKTK